MAFANFIEETCTGTTGDLALTGATTGRIQFSKAFADGDPVEYSVEDSAGTIKELGTGTYVTTGDKITRDNPRTTWNGTTYENENATIQTLSGGTHTVRVSTIADIPQNALVSIPTGQTIFSTNMTAGNNTDQAMVVDTLYLMSFLVDKPVDVTDFKYRLNAAGAGSGTSKYVLGLYRVDTDGTILDLLFQSGEIDSTVTGGITTAITGGTQHVPPGEYMLAALSDDTPSFNFVPTRGTGKNALGAETANASGWWGYTTQATTYSATLPAAPSLGTRANGNKHFIIGLKVA